MGFCEQRIAKGVDYARIAARVTIDKRVRISREFHRINVPCQLQAMPNIVRSFLFSASANIELDVTAEPDRAHGR